MKVMKFGGTSVGKPERMHDVATLITRDEEEKIVVLSALSGTTNSLVEIGAAMANGDRAAAKQVIDKLDAHYQTFISNLLATEEAQTKCRAIIAEHFEFLNIILKISFNEALNKDILAQGELMSTKMFSCYLEEKGINHMLLPALDFMTIDSYDEPQVGTIKVKLVQLLNKHRDTSIFITQGYISRNARGEVDNLKRGGSDYTATIIGAAVRAETIQIWTDIDGMHNNDPRIVEGTKPVENLSYNEAAELAYFGAKILHPTCVWPAQKYNIPVWLKNTMQPAAKGTVISEVSVSNRITAIAAKDSITAIKIRSGRMLNAYGFLRSIFEVFERYKTSIDMITTSEVAVSLTIDDDSRLSEILEELKKYALVEVDKNQTIICIVGDFLSENKGYAQQIFGALKDIPIRMISYGGSSNNVTLLINETHKKEALISLHKGLF